MGKKLVSDKIERELNKQMTREGNAAQFYLAMGSWAESNGYDGVAEFLYHHANEERAHMMKLLEFVNQRGGHCKIEALDKPAEHPNSLEELFNDVLKQEIENSEQIYKIVDIVLADRDWATFNFLQWFVKEQIEEETLALALVDKLKIIGEDRGDKGGIYALNESVRGLRDVKDAREAKADGL